jgi:hypothetical protein
MGNSKSNAIAKENMDRAKEKSWTLRVAAVEDRIHQEEAKIARQTQIKDNIRSQTKKCYDLYGMISGKPCIIDGHPLPDELYNIVEEYYNGGGRHNGTSPKYFTLSQCDIISKILPQFDTLIKFGYNIHECEKLDHWGHDILIRFYKIAYYIQNTKSMDMKNVHKLQMLKDHLYTYDSDHDIDLNTVLGTVKFPLIELLAVSFTKLDFRTPIEKLMSEEVDVQDGTVIKPSPVYVGQIPSAPSEE